LSRVGKLGEENAFSRKLVLRDCAPHLPNKNVNGSVDSKLAHRLEIGIEQRSRMLKDDLRPLCHRARIRIALPLEQKAVRAVVDVPSPIHTRVQYWPGDQRERRPNTELVIQIRQDIVVALLANTQKSARPTDGGLK
jgi:hypothetical protein